MAANTGGASAWDSTAWDARYREAQAGDEARLWSAVPPAIVIDTVPAWAPGRALDLATGDGRTAIWLATLGWTVTGIDFSAEAIGLARKHADDAGAAVRWLVADAVSWSPEERFDLVTIMYLQLPEADLRRVLARAAGWVAPGGHLLVIGHDRLNVGTGAPGPRNPDILHTPELLRSSVGDLEVLRCETAGRDLATDPEGPEDARAHGAASHRAASHRAASHRAVTSGADAPSRFALDTVLIAVRPLPR